MDGHRKALEGVWWRGWTGTFWWPNFTSHKPTVSASRSRFPFLFFFGLTHFYQYYDSAARFLWANGEFLSIPFPFFLFLLLISHLTSTTITPLFFGERNALHSGLQIDNAKWASPPFPTSFHSFNGTQTCHIFGCRHYPAKKNQSRRKIRRRSARKKEKRKEKKKVSKCPSFIATKYIYHIGLLLLRLSSRMETLLPEFPLPSQGESI